MGTANSDWALLIMLRRIVGFYESQSGKIGPDPLREDADVEVVWQKMQKSKKPVGLVLMDQSMVAGIGNIYRAEILFKVDFCYQSLQILFLCPCPTPG